MSGTLISDADDGMQQVRIQVSQLSEISSVDSRATSLGVNITLESS